MQLTSRSKDEIVNPYHALLLAKDNNILNENFKWLYMLSYTTPRASIQQFLQKNTQPVNKNLNVQKVLQQTQTCLTSALGYHLYQCSDEQCEHIKYQYNIWRDIFTAVF